MFQDVENEVINIQSSWKREKKLTDKGFNTDELRFTDQSLQTISTETKECQTDTQATPSTDDELLSLSKWLSGIYPMISSELTETNWTKVLLESDEIIDYATFQQCIPSEKDERVDFHESHISRLAWNSTGNSFFVTYSHSHDAWCHHNSVVYIYSKNRDGIYSTQTRKSVIVGFCLTAIATHKVIPSVFALGTYEGSLLLFNTALSGSSELIKSITVHQEKITKLLWISDESLVSSDITGEIIIWKVSLSSALVDITPRNTFTMASVTDTMASSRLAVTCFAFSESESETNLFIVGCEGGNLFQCSVHAAKVLSDKSHNPIVSAYNGHAGDVISIEFSPMTVNSFLSASCDGEIHIYDVTKAQPLRIIRQDNIVCVTWILDYVLACGNSGNIQICNPNGQQSFFFKIDSKGFVNDLQIALKSEKIVLGEQNGDVQIWNFNWKRLVSQLPSKNR